MNERNAFDYFFSSFAFGYRLRFAAVLEGFTGSSLTQGRRCERVVKSDDLT